MQFSSNQLTARLEMSEIKISMDGKSRALDNVFVERLWRSVKYEDIRPLSKLDLAREIEDFSANFWAKRGRHTQRVEDEQEQTFVKKSDLNSRMGFRKSSIHPKGYELLKEFRQRLKNYFEFYITRRIFV